MEERPCKGIGHFQIQDISFRSPRLLQSLKRSLPTQSVRWYLALSENSPTLGQGWPFVIPSMRQSLSQQYHYSTVFCLLVGLLGLFTYEWTVLYLRRYSLHLGWFLWHNWQLKTFELWLICLLESRMPEHTLRDNKTLLVVCFVLFFIFIYLFLIYAFLRSFDITVYVCCYLP